MSANLPRVDWFHGKIPVRGLRLVAVLALMAAWTAGPRSQEDPPGDKPGVKKDEPTAPQASSTVFVLVHMKKKTMAPDELEQTFKEAADKLKSPGATVAVRPLEPQFYRALQNLTEKLENTREALDSDKPTVRQRGAEGKIEWELALNTPGFTLSELDLLSTDKDGKVANKHTLKPDTASRSDAVLRRRSLDRGGVWSVRLDPSEVPNRFVARGTLFDEKGGRKDNYEITGNWEEMEHYYLVALKNFTGSHKDLLKKVTDKTKDGVTNPLDDAVPGQDLTFVFASLGFSLSRPGSFEENRYIPVLSSIEGRNPTRVWIRFPLTRKEAEDELKKYSAMKITEVSKAIRDNKPVWADENKTLTLTPEGSAQWIELPFNEKKQGFSRELELKGIAGLATKYPNAHRLVVYEGGSKEQGVVIIVAGRGQDNAQERGAKVVAEEVKEWAPGIADLAAKEKKTPK
jgi:hypothetical protein